MALRRVLSGIWDLMTTLVTPMLEQLKVNSAQRDGGRGVGSAVAAASGPVAENVRSSLHLLWADRDIRPQHTDNYKRMGSVGEMTHRQASPTGSLIVHGGDECFPQYRF